MKMKALAIILPALMAAGVSQAAEIYNKNGNKVDLYGKMVGERVWVNTDKSNSENADTSYARLGVKGETQIQDQLTGYGQFEFNMKANTPEGSQSEDTRLAFAGLNFADYGSFDYGRNYGVAYDAAAYTDMLVKWGGDSWAATDNYMTNRTNGVATYRNSDFFGMVEGLNFALQYQGKNDATHTAAESNGDGYSVSVSYDVDGFGVVGAYGKSDRTNKQTIDHNGSNAEVWSLAAKYDANNVYAAVMYGETRNLTTLNKGGEGEKALTDPYSSFNKTQNVEAVVQYQFDFGLRPSLGYVYSKGKDLTQGNQHGVSADRLNYIEVGTWYFFNKNFNVYTAYKFNLMDEDDAAITNGSTADEFAMGIVYQF